MTAVLTSLDAILAPTRSALLVVDVQHDFVHPDGWAARHHPGSPSLRHVIPAINRLIRAARAAAVPVVYVLMEHGPTIDLPNYRARYAARDMEDDILCAAGTWGARLDGEVTPPGPADLTIVRHSYDAFEGTPLDGLLRERHVESVVGTGVVTNLCVQTTIQHAFALGYYIVIAEDATAATDPIVQAVTLANFRQYFGPVVPSETIRERWQESSPSHDSRPRGAAPA
jgi:ureidoacrylate peracid hydrolase